MHQSNPLATGIFSFPPAAKLILVNDIFQVTAHCYLTCLGLISMLRGVAAATTSGSSSAETWLLTVINGCSPGLSRALESISAPSTEVHVATLMNALLTEPTARSAIACQRHVPSQTNTTLWILTKQHDKQTFHTRNGWILASACTAGDVLLPKQGTCH